LKLKLAILSFGSRMDMQIPGGAIRLRKSNRMSKDKTTVRVIAESTGKPCNTCFIFVPLELNYFMLEYNIYVNDERWFPFTSSCKVCKCCFRFIVRTALIDNHMF